MKNFILSILMFLLSLTAFSCHKIDRFKDRPDKRIIDVYAKPVIECTEGNNLKVIHITPQDSDERYSFKLNSGDYFLAKMALCVNAKTPDTAVTENMDTIMAITSEFFLKYQPNDLFINYDQWDETASERDKSGDDLLLDDMMNDVGKSQMERFREIRQRLADSLQEKYDFIHEVYLYEIDISPTINGTLESNSPENGSP